MSNMERHPASFKDPSGFVFQKDFSFYRQVNQLYAEEYDLLMSSGLYQELTDKKYLIPHAETDKHISGTGNCYKTLLPEQLSFITYPYEWCFDQLKDAALLTLAIQKTSIRYGMILKDAAHFNVQFRNGRPVFIDTLSFEKYDASKPWIAYRQFCECFLFPLFLQKYLKIEIQKFMLAYPSGIPVDVTKKMLPWKSNFNLGVGLHVSLQSKIKADNDSRGYTGQFDQTKMLRLITNLEDNIKACTLNEKDKTNWSNYYDETIISQSYLSEKEIIFRRLMSFAAFKTVLDIGANDGFFSKIISEKAASVVSIDFDAYCINNLYCFTKKANRSNILPLCIDFSNPTPATGFNNTEHASFLQRAQFDLILALAILHHLSITKNIPLADIAGAFGRIAKTVIVEFVSKDDVKLQQLLRHRKDIFSNYHEAGFEEAFGKYFTTISKDKIPGTSRTLYLLKRKED
ncbi:MAG: class I SAM-dependent methyltransferase [Bacteroidota bacterium]|nr:class I SAM-dependent methyltransferase [Bacteroidota bacterium]